ncbi:MAG: GGDEF domain-containing protein [Saccharospirillum sp.]
MDKSKFPKSVYQTVVGLIDQSKTLLAVHDDDDRLIYANPAYRSAFFLSAASDTNWFDMMRDNFALQRGPIIEAEDIDQWLAYARSRRRSEPFREFDVDLRDGRWIHMTETVQDGLGMLTIGIEVTAAKQAVSSLKDQFGRVQRQAETDELTHLGNRRLLERLKQFIANDDSIEEIAAIMIDIDHFKPYNDALGHLAGDVCLKRVADLLVDSLRTRHDNALRYGGEEFLILMPGTSLATARAVGERIRQTVEGQALPHPMSPLGLITVSIGVAHIRNQDPDNINRVVHRADEALYVAKKAGRNQVHVAPPTPDDNGSSPP